MEFIQNFVVELMGFANWFMYEATAGQVMLIAGAVWFIHYMDKKSAEVDLRKSWRKVKTAWEARKSK